MTSSEEQPFDVEMFTGFDTWGNASVSMRLGEAKVSGLSAGDATHLAMMLLDTVAASKARAAMYRNLLLKGWAPDAALALLDDVTP